MKNFLIVLLVVVALAVGGVFTWKKFGPEPQAASAGKIRATTAVAEKRDIKFFVNVAGDIGPAEQVSVRPEVNGKIDSLPVDIGDAVKKNQILFTLDDKDLQTERSQRVTEIDGAKLSLKGAQVNRDQAKRNFDRAQELFDGKLISQEIFEESRTEHEKAKNQVDLAQNSLFRANTALAQVDERLTKTKIQAPFDCTILTRPVSVGQAVSGSGGFNSGTEVLTIANLQEMVIIAHVNQVDVTRLFINQEVEIKIDSVPGLEIKGAVDRLAPQATIKNGIKGFACRIQLKAPDKRVRPGMTANISIPVASAGNVVSVPLSAVFSEQGERFVYVKKEDGSLERTVVQIGVSDFFFAEVVKGLAGGEEVSLEGPETKMQGGKAPGAQGGSGRPGASGGATNRSPSAGGPRASR